jgi:hypothetical protein
MNHRCYQWYALAMVLHRSKNWNLEDGKKILIAQPLLGIA